MRAVQRRVRHDALQETRAKYKVHVLSLDGFDEQRVTSRAVPLTRRSCVVGNMSSQEDDNELVAADEADVEDIVNMAFPSGDEPVEMDAFVQKLQDIDVDDLDEDKQGTAITTVTLVIDALQDAFPTADVSIDRTTADADVTVQVVIDAEDTEDDVRERVPDIVDAATADCETSVSTTVVQPPTDDESSTSDEGGVIIE